MTQQVMPADLIHELRVEKGENDEGRQDREQIRGSDVRETGQAIGGHIFDAKLLVEIQIRQQEAAEDKENHHAQVVEVVRQVQKPFAPHVGVNHHQGSKARQARD